MLEPNRANILTWVQGLESDEFEQGQGTLRTADNKYCCLGVACEMAHRAGVVSSGLYGVHEVYEYGGATAYLPSSVMQWLGVDSYDPWVLFEEQTMLLATCNDSGDMDFKQIARLIRDTYLKEEEGSGGEPSGE